jgi:3-hydroxyisobutyrate dehydrogenase
MSSSSTAANVSGRPISPDTTRVAWVVTGVMGQSMVGHLLAASYTLTDFTRTASKVESLVSHGAHLENSPRAAATTVDIIFLMVGFPSDVHSTALDPSTGALASLAPDGVLVDMTTSDPTLAVEITTVGCTTVDAPVSSGDCGARNAALSIFVGYDVAVVACLAPLFKLVGNQIAIASTMVGLVEGIWCTPTRPGWTW